MAALDTQTIFSPKQVNNNEMTNLWAQVTMHGVVSKKKILR